MEFEKPEKHMDWRNQLGPIGKEKPSAEKPSQAKPAAGSEKVKPEETPDYDLETMRNIFD